MVITTTCTRCGQPLEHCLPDDMPDFQEQWAKRLAACTVHKACREKARHTHNTLSADEIQRAWSAKVPPRLADTDGALLPAKIAFAKAMNWRWGPNGLMFIGPTGTGKSRTLYLLLGREFRLGREIDAITHSEFFSFIQRNWNEEPNLVKRKIYYWKSCDIFALDDLGKGKQVNINGATTLPEDVLWEIMEARWNDRLPVFITTQLEPRALLGSLPVDRATALERRITEFCPAIHFKH